MSPYLIAVDDQLPMRASGEWAKVKLDYLNRYIDVFESSMHSKWRIRNYIDLQAGPGKDRIRGADEVILGSPLLALAARHPFTGYHFVELEPRNVDALAQRCSHSPNAGIVSIDCGDCNVRVHSIVTRLKRNEAASLNLAFLDPEGFEMRWSTVEALASVRRMDLIINYPQGGLNRLMPLALTERSDTSVDSFFGTRDWREIFDAHRRTGISGIHRELIDLYKNRLYGLGYAEVVQGNEVSAEPLMRNTARNAPLYRLIFASKHPLGNRFWREVTKRDVSGQRSLF